MKPETIKKILDEGKTSDELVAILHQDTELRKKLESIEFRMDQLEKKYRKDRADLKGQLENLRRECPHYDRGYQPDPSGNNDGLYYCTLCGKEL